MADLTLDPSQVEEMRQRLDGPQPAASLMRWMAGMQRNPNAVAPPAQRRGQRRNSDDEGSAERPPNRRRARSRSPTPEPEPEPEEPQQQQQEEESEEEEPEPMRKTRRALPPSIQRMQASGPGWRLDPRKKCFFCERGQPNNPCLSYENLRQMADCYQADLTHTERQELVEQLVLLCNKDIIAEANKEKLAGEADIPPVTEAEFHRHFTRHGNDFGMKAVVRSDWLDEMLHCIWEQDCWVEDEVVAGTEIYGPTRVCHHGVKLLREMLMLEKSLHGQNPKRAMFSNSGIGMPSEDPRPLFNTRKHRLHSRNVGRYTGTAPNQLGNDAGVGSTIAGSGLSGIGANGGRSGIQGRQRR